MKTLAFSEEKATAVESVILKETYSLTPVQWARMKQYI